MHNPKLELARAVDTIEGSIYIHCHHGKHRSAAASAAATVQVGILTPDEATARMKVSGPSASYPGLYACAYSARADKSALATIDTDFPERFVVTGLVKSMVEIDIVTEHLAAIEKAAWKIPKDHPDLVPAAEAGLLVDVFRHLLDDRRVKAKPAEFMRMLEEQIAAAQAVEDGIVAGESPDLLAPKWKAVVNACRDCHAVYRNK